MTGGGADSQSRSGDTKVPLLLIPRGSVASIKIPSHCRMYRPPLSPPNYERLMIACDMVFKLLGEIMEEEKRIGHIDDLLTLSKIQMTMYEFYCKFRSHTTY